MTDKELELSIIKKFVAEVEQLAEKNMLKTFKLEGAHYVAMKQLVKEKEQEIRKL